MHDDHPEPQWSGDPQIAEEARRWHEAQEAARHRDHDPDAAFDQEVMVRVADGSLPPSVLTWLGAYRLGCLRSAIVLVWSLVACLTGAFLMLGLGWPVDLVVPDADPGTVGLLALGLGLLWLVLVAFVGSVLTIRRIQPWTKAGPGAPPMGRIRRR